MNLFLIRTLLAVILMTGFTLPVQAQSASHLAVARDVVVLSGVSRSFDAIVPQLMDQVRQTTVTRPDITKDLNAVLESLKPEMEQQKQGMIDTAAKIYATRMTEAELKDVVTFFKSTSGKKYVETQPYMLDDMFKEMQAWTQKVAEVVMTRTRTEMAKRGHQM